MPAPAVIHCTSPSPAARAEAVDVVHEAAHGHGDGLEAPVRVLGEAWMPPSPWYMDQPAGCEIAPDVVAAEARVGPIFALPFGYLSLWNTPKRNGLSVSKGKVSGSTRSTAMAQVSSAARVTAATRTAAKALAREIVAASTLGGAASEFCRARSHHLRCQQPTVPAARRHGPDVVRPVVDGRGEARDPRVAREDGKAASAQHALEDVLWNKKETVLILDNRVIVDRSFLRHAKHPAHAALAASVGARRALPNAAYRFSAGTRGVKRSGCRRPFPLAVITKMTGYDQCGVLVPNPYFGPDLDAYARQTGEARALARARPLASRVGRALWRGNISSRACDKELGNRARLAATALSVDFPDLFDARCPPGGCDPRPPSEPCDEADVAARILADYGGSAGADVRQLHGDDGRRRRGPGRVPRGRLRAAVQVQ
ncbi:hypothetical protein JL722_1400 [Aureococcus anophagefferens]|nr:hypothetical protein JL722_1400 [Aureococcus anophagefferens]